jgi:hypothetical protein
MDNSLFRINVSSDYIGCHDVRLSFTLEDIMNFNKSETLFDLKDILLKEIGRLLANEMLNEIQSKINKEEIIKEVQNAIVQEYINRLSKIEN